MDASMETAMATASDQQYRRNEKGLNKQRSASSAQLARKLWYDYTGKRAPQSLNNETKPTHGGTKFVDLLDEILGMNGVGSTPRSALIALEELQ